MNTHSRIDHRYRKGHILQGRVWLILVFVLFALGAKATTWSPVYPFVQRTGDGKVSCRSVPYGVRDGPRGLGETFVYDGGRLLYSIDKYFSSPFFTCQNGRYLATVDFHLSYRADLILREDGGLPERKVVEPDGGTIRVYDEGILLKTISFSELAVPLASAYVNEASDRLSWNFETSEDDPLLVKMAKYPAFVEGDTLYLITADDQLIKVHMPTGAIAGRSVASVTLVVRKAWDPQGVKRKYERVKYPDKFFLPPLKDGRSMAEATASLFGMTAMEEHKRDADLVIYVHTLLLNDHGRCELVYATVASKEGKVDDQELKRRFEAWVFEQVFDTRSMPRKSPKFKYSGFVFLDRKP
jgi:hypothetical protein